VVTPLLLPMPLCMVHSALSENKPLLHLLLLYGAFLLAAARVLTLPAAVVPLPAVRASRTSCCCTWLSMLY
jgi:hypothetical protein